MYPSHAYATANQVQNNFEDIDMQMPKSALSQHNVSKGDKVASQNIMTLSDRQSESESYEEAPYEKSHNEGLNLIIFQGNNNEAQEEIEREEPESAQNLLSSINSMPENASTPPSNQESIANQNPQQPALPAMQIQVSEPQSQFSRTEDFLLQLSPQSLEGVASLASIDSEQMLNSNQQVDIASSSWPKNEKSGLPLVEIVQPNGGSWDNSQKIKFDQSLGETIKYADNLDQVDDTGEKNKVDTVQSPLNLLSTEPRPEVKFDNQTPKKDNCQKIATLMTSSKSDVKNTDSEPSHDAEGSEIVSHDKIKLQIIERSASPQEIKFSIGSSALEFEEAVNPSGSQVASSGPIVESHKKGPETFPILRPGISTAVKQGPKYDIDSLNEVKKANDFASKKVEITNFIFDILVGEIKDNLFPLRDDDEEHGNRYFQQSSTGMQGIYASHDSNLVVHDNNLEMDKARTGRMLSSNQVKDQNTPIQKKKKRRVQRRVKKPDVLPKVKEIKDGLPVDVCLKRIQSVTKATPSINSGDLTSFSATQSLSISKDTGLSYLDNTKGKEQNEISSQFHEIELVKQEQMDLLEKKMAISELKEYAKPLDIELKQLQTNLRGIKTTTDVVDAYLNNLFETLLSSEQDFLDDLATPLAQNAVHELQNVQVLALNAKKTLMDNKKQKLFTEKKNQETVREKDENLEIALFGFSQHQQPVLSVEMYLEIERQKDYVLLADSISEINMSMTDNLSQSRDAVNEPAASTNAAQDGEDTLGDRNIRKQRQNLVENQSMLAEWENIHNKVLFDAVNDSLDEFRPYGLRGPPAPWSGQTRALTYRYSQNAKEVLQQVKEKVVGLSKTFGGALANSELLREYHIRGPLESDKLQMLREERLAIMMIQDVEETQHKWEDLERQETGIKIELSEMILAQLTEEIVNELSTINKRDLA